MYRIRLFAFLFGLLSIIATPNRAEARYDLIMISPVDPPATAEPGGQYNFTVFLTVSGEANPCGTLYAYLYPATGGIFQAIPPTPFNANGNYRADIPYTMPQQEGVYLFDVLSVVEFCNGRLWEYRWDNISVTVQAAGGGDDGGGDNGDVESDLEVDNDDFDDTIYVGDETCGDVEIENNSRRVTYEIDAVELRARGVDVDWHDDRDGGDEVLEPGDDEWFGDFCFTPEEPGTLRLDVIVELEDDNDEYDVDTIRIEVLDPNCVRTECWNDDRWCIDRNGGRNHVFWDCGNDVVGQCGASYCSNDDVYCTRADFDNSCSNDTCHIATRETPVLVQDCGVDTQGVCRNNRCDGNRIVCDRTDTDRYCANARCGSQQVQRIVVARTCANNEQCVNAACIPRDCVRTECHNDDRWCVNADGGYDHIAQDCGNDEVGQCSNHRCDANGDVVCDRTDVNHFCLEDQCRQQSVNATVVADDCTAVLEVCQNGVCANRCLFECFDQCDGDTLVVRACEGFVCEEQNRDDCNRLDNRGLVERYCSGNAVHGRQQVTDGYCGGVLNACRTDTSTEQLGVLDVCADYCANNESVTNRGCQNGACGAGQRLNCDTLDTPPEPVEYCDGDMLRTYNTWRDVSCEPATGRCDRVVDRTGMTRPIENCADRPPLDRVVEWVCAGGRPTSVHEVSLWGCQGNACEVDSVEVIEVAEDVCEPWEHCVGEGLCEPAPCEITQARWLDEDAQDGDLVPLEVAFRGDCQAHEVSVVVRETDGSIIDFFNDEVVLDTIALDLGRDGASRGEWIATFAEGDWYENPEYIFRVERGGERIAESENVLRVTPRQFDLGSLRDILSSLEVQQIQPPPCPDYGTVTLSSECPAERAAAGVHGEVTDDDTISEEDVLEWLGIGLIVNCAVCIPAGIVTYAAGVACPETFGGTCVAVFPWSFPIMNVSCAICFGAEPAIIGAGRTAFRRQAAPGAISLVVRTGAKTREFELAQEVAAFERVADANGVRFTYQTEARAVGAELLPTLEEVLYESATLRAPSIRYVNPPWVWPGGTRLMDFAKIAHVDYGALESSAIRMERAALLFIEENSVRQIQRDVAVLSRRQFRVQDLFPHGEEEPSIRFVETLGRGRSATTHLIDGSVDVSMEAFLRVDGALATAQFTETVFAHELANVITRRLITRLPDPSRRGQLYRLNLDVNAMHVWNRHAHQYLNDGFAFGQFRNARLTAFQRHLIPQIEDAFAINGEKWVFDWTLRNTDLTLDSRWGMARFYSLARDIEATGNAAAGQLADAMLFMLREFATEHAPQRAQQVEQEFLFATTQLRKDGIVYADHLFARNPSQLLDQAFRRYHIVAEPR